MARNNLQRDPSEMASQHSRIGFQCRCRCIDTSPSPPARLTLADYAAMSDMFRLTKEQTRDALDLLVEADCGHFFPGAWIFCLQVCGMSAKMEADQLQCLMLLEMADKYGYAQAIGIDAPGDNIMYSLAREFCYCIDCKHVVVWEEPCCDTAAKYLAKVAETDASADVPAPATQSRAAGGETAQRQLHVGQDGGRATVGADDDDDEIENVD